MAISRRHALALGAGGVSALILPGCSGGSRETVAAAPLERVTVLQKIRSRRTTDGDGATLRRIFPGPELRHLDPFVLLDDFDVQQPAGFPTHPHRGFEAFTYMIEGAFEHRDTMGNHSVVLAGGTQRFNSGAGAKHSEMPGSDSSNRGLQLWVNLPKRMKKMEPEYGDTQAADMPLDADQQRTIRTISGSGLSGTSSPVGLHTDVDYLDVTMHDEAFSIEVPSGRNTLVYALAGTFTVGPNTVRRGEGVIVSAGLLEVKAEAGTRFAYLSGVPHNEPIRHRGPFVD